ncbi:WD40 repeat domain-containing protein [Actinacidiphila acididurans]|uniref:WD40 repeat domain-containing protein n=1 Tax=Actinacidiphila acididurans TaxID=2784346 RepID=A0ABS2TX26_9ACTN|nr:WD40 repeat domain-containing protein [Actinacidiphila acididurans]MBM9507889.1 WD40 repeat domain-containing protein [Actinacidiphila acididurans]
MRVVDVLSIDTGYAHAVHPLIASGADGEPLLFTIWGNGSEIRRWDVRSGEVVRRYAEELPGCNDSVLASLPDGRRVLAVATEDGVERWDALTGEPLGGVYPMGKTIWGLAAGALPDGRTVLVGAGHDGTVHRWDPATGEPLGPVLRGHRPSVLSVGLVRLPTSQAVIVSGDDSGFLRRWDAVTGDPLCEPVLGHASQVDIIVPLASDGARRLFASCDSAGEMCLWDAATGEQAGGALTTVADVYVMATACPARTPLLFAAGADGRIAAWNVTTREPVDVSLSGVSVALLDRPDGTVVVATGTSRGGITLCSLSG